jgi:thiol-disulfide isomerase/thioredoxin
MAARSSEPAGLHTALIRLPVQGELPPFGGATGWLNSPPLSAAGLRGKVVLVNFWTYTCINWLRQLPYLRTWSSKYADDGLVVIGVHTPEFAFEKDLDNVRRAVQQMKIGYPIVVDNDYAIWRAFNNRYWPALYFVDARGRLRAHHFGEGSYERSEQTIRELLAEAGAAVDHQDVVPAIASSVEVQADWRNLRSSEMYLGHARADAFSSPGGAALGQRRVYAAPASLRLNHWALAGEWTIASEPAILNKAPGRIVCRFHARDLHLVMRPLRQDRPVRFRVSMDGQRPDPTPGLDVDGSGTGTLVEPRLYQLIRQSGPIVDRTFEIEFLDAGVEAFAFTFG